MHKFVNISSLRCLFTAVFVCFSCSSFSADETEEDLRFWEKWNAAIAQRVQQELSTPDPWEGFNRKIYAFNDVADRYFLKPVTKSYQWITPDFVETGVSNAFSNILDINTIANDLLQLKFSQALSDTGRFVLNTTVGLVGLFDVASPLGLEKHNEDFGQTLGYWGVGPGPYLVIPFLGSSDLRDGFSLIVDSQTNIINEVDHIPTRNQIYALRTVDARAGLFAAEQLLTGDKYTFLRDAYLQRRAFLVNDGVTEDTFGEEDFEDEWEE